MSLTLKPSICNCVSHYLSGHGRVIYETTKRLSRHFDVTTVAEHIEMESPATMKLVRWSLPWTSNLPIADKKLVKWLRSFDVIHVHSLPFVWSAIATGKPVLITAHESPPPSAYGRIDRRIKSLIVHSLSRLAYQNADAIVSISSSVCQALRDAKIASIVIPHGVDRTRFRPLHADAVSSRRSGDPMLLYVGGNQPTKCVNILLKALLELKRVYPRIGLTIIGYGEFNGTRQVATKLGLSQSVKIVGKVPLDELPAYYNASDVFVTASRWEGFCLPVIEAFACGKPVVGRDAYAVGEHIRASGAGVLVTSDSGFPDAIEKALGSKEQFSSRALYYANKFDWDTTASSLAGLINKLTR